MASEEGMGMSDENVEFETVFDDAPIEVRSQSKNSGKETCSEERKRIILR